jgi:hypothetical protein
VQACELIHIFALPQLPLRISSHHPRPALGAQDRPALVGTGALPGGIENIQLTLPRRHSPTDHCEVPEGGSLITDYRLPITNYRLPITDYQLPNLVAIKMKDD